MNGQLQLQHGGTAKDQTPNRTRQHSQHHHHQSDYLNGIAVNRTPALHRPSSSPSIDASTTTSSTSSITRPVAHRGLTRPSSAGRLKPTLMTVISSEEFDSLPPSIQNANRNPRRVSGSGTRETANVRSRSVVTGGRSRREIFLKRQPPLLSSAGSIEPLRRHTSMTLYTIDPCADVVDRRKYFSSVERLRIAQLSAAQRRKKQVPTTETTAEAYRLSSTASMEDCGAARPKSAHSIRAASFSRQRGSTATQPESTAGGLLALPDKVKRSFAIEEIAQLTDNASRSPLPAPARSTTGEPYHLRMTAGRTSSVTSSNCRSIRSLDRREDVENVSVDLETQSCRSLEFLRSPDMETYNSYAKRRHDSINSAYSALPALPSQHSPISSTTRKSFSRQRALLLAPLPLPPPRLTPAVPPLPSPTTLKSFQAKSLRAADMPPPALDPAPSTKYYKDTHARQKLREYLSSPEKFDEAVEFGFPSEQSPVARSGSLSSATDPGLHLDNDSMSNSNSRDDDDESSLRCPRTPSLLAESDIGPVSQHPSIDSGVALPAAGIKTRLRSLTPDFDGRQMTLRMTLTRPELRAPEEELYSFQRKEVSGVEVEACDPLALEPLTITEDHSGMQGAFAVSPRTAEKSFKKMWKTLRGRCPT